MTSPNADRTLTIDIQTTNTNTCAVLAKTDRILAIEWPPAGRDNRWRVRGLWSEPEHHTNASDARAALLRVATAALEKLPPCGMTHDEHTATWKSWRDDCVDPVTGCGFAVRDVDQCERGHPDDGVEYCGACGHDVQNQVT